MRFMYLKQTASLPVPCLVGCPEFNEPSTVRMIELDHKSIAQQRPRARLVTQKDGRKPYIHMYTPTSNLKEKLDREACKVLGIKDLSALWGFSEEAWQFAVLSIYKTPPSWSKKKTLELSGTLKLTKPDSTNILKFYEDWLEGWFIPKDQFLQGPMNIRLWGDRDATYIAAVPFSRKIHLIKTLKLLYPPML